MTASEENGTTCVSAKKRLDLNPHDTAACSRAFHAPRLVAWRKELETCMDADRRSALQDKIGRSEQKVSSRDGGRRAREKATRMSNSLSKSGRILSRHQCLHLPFADIRLSPLNAHNLSQYSGFRPLVFG